MGIDYRKYHRDKQYVENEELFKNIFTKRYDLICKFIKSPKRVLDIGCSNGVFLDLFEESETWGIEPSKNADIASVKKHKILNVTFEKADLIGNFFDLVIMNHTLEHVQSAEVVLNKIYKILRPKGILFIDVPNAGGLGSKLLGERWPYRLPEEHTYQFTKESLSKKLINSKFNVSYWESRSGLFEFSNPLVELWQSFVGLKKRFITNIILYPYYFVSTITGMGDSMSFIVKK